MTPPNPTTHRLADDTVLDALRRVVDEFWAAEEADYNEQREQAQQADGGDDNLGYHPFDALRELKAWLDKPTPDSDASPLHPAEHESLLRLLTTTAELDAQLPDHDRTPYRDALNSFGDPDEIERLVAVARQVVAND